VTKALADKLPSLQSELLSTQQVDIENYNVSASRLLTPTRTEKKLQETQKKPLTLMNVISKKHNKINFKDKNLIVKLCVR
jgi:hypothetical protein